MAVGGVLSVGHPHAARAQSVPDANFVAIGKLAPDFLLSRILNFPRTRAHLSDFAGKALILDFWATYCSPCVGSMPDMIAFQHRFAGQVQFMLIGPEGDSTVQAFFVRKPELRLPIAADRYLYDTLANRFGIPGLGSYVWIDNGGIVRAVTDHDQVTAEHIQALIDGRPLSLPSTVGYGAPALLQSQLPFLVANNGSAAVSGLRFHSVLTGALAGSNSYSTTTGDGPYKGRRFFAVNMPIESLYQDAYSRGFLGYSYVRTRLEVADTSRYVWGSNATAYCYELIVPAEFAKQQQTLMRQDLDRYFGTTAHIEKRHVKVYVLTRTNYPAVSLPPLEPVDSSTAAAGFPQGDGHLRIPGSFFYTLQQLLERMLKVPVVDETGIAGTVDLGYDYTQLPNELKGVDAYRRALAKHGLDLVEAERDVDFLVIRERAPAQ